MYFSGRWNEILKSDYIKKFDVFEDGPFESPMFARFLYENIKNSYFVYLERPKTDWFNSMITHSNGYTLGDLEKHCFTYNRLNEIDELRKLKKTIPSKLIMFNLRKKYEDLYLEHKSQVSFLFKDVTPMRFFNGNLYEKEIFKKMALHFNLKLSDMTHEHSHKSTKSVSDILSKFK